MIRATNMLAVECYLRMLLQIVHDQCCLYRDRTVQCLHTLLTLL